MPKMNRFPLATALCLALTGTVSAAEGPVQDNFAAKPAPQMLSRDAQGALICQTVTTY